MRIDARIPVRFGRLEDRQPGDTLLIEGTDGPQHAARFDVQARSHPQGCTCCIAREDAGIALADLFTARARDHKSVFVSVLAITRTEAGIRAVKTALASDPVASARFRLA